MSISDQADDASRQNAAVQDHPSEISAGRHCGHADFLRERIDGRVGQ